MKIFFYQKLLSLCFALVLVQGLVLAQNDEIEKVTNVVDLLMLQIELNTAASNRQHDIIQIGEGMFDLSLLDQDLVYYPLPQPKVNKEERYPIMIVGAGVGK